jgi:protein translocase SecG subunit
MILTIAHIIVSVLLIITVLLQAQGGGLSTSFGGGGEFYRSRQSVEKFLIGATVVLTILFGFISLALLIR